MTGKVVNSFGKEYKKEKPTDTFLIKVKECLDPEDNPAEVYIIVERQEIEQT